MQRDKGITSKAELKVLLADRKVVAPCNEHGVFIIICEV